MFMWCYFTNNTMKLQYLNITDNLMVALEWSNKPSSRTAPSYRLKSNKGIIRNQGRTDLKLQVFKLLTGLHFSQGQIKIYTYVYISDTTSTMTSFSQICQIKKYVLGNSAQLIIMFCSKDASNWIMKSTFFLKKSNRIKLVIKNIKAHMYKHYWNLFMHIKYVYEMYVFPWGRKYCYLCELQFRARIITFIYLCFYIHFSL